MFLACHQARMEMEEAAKHSVLVMIETFNGIDQAQTHGSMRALLPPTGSDTISGLKALGFEFLPEPHDDPKNIVKSMRTFGRKIYLDLDPPASIMITPKPDSTAEFLIAAHMIVTLTQERGLSEAVVSYETSQHQCSIRRWKDTVLVDFVRNVFPSRVVRPLEEWSVLTEQELQAIWEINQGTEWKWLDNVFAVGTQDGWYAMTCHRDQLS
jgi:hypothetical protein